LSGRRQQSTVDMLPCKSIFLRCNIPHGIPAPDHFDIVNRCAKHWLRHLLWHPSFNAVKFQPPCRRSSVNLAAYSCRLRCATHRHARVARDCLAQVVSADPYLRGIVKTHPVGTVLSGSSITSHQAPCHEDHVVGRVHRWNRASGMRHTSFISVIFGHTRVHAERLSLHVVVRQRRMA
jgi:hypothetical protein